MKNISKTLFFVIPGLLLLTTYHSFTQESSDLSWPEINAETKPWTRWWWMGSAVNEADLTTAMEEYKKAGLGGLELTPIYGVKGYENQFIPYLSPDWIDMFQFTLDEADRLGLGVDMATGTGWPFGGPWVTPEDACKNLVYKTFILKAGESLNETVIYIQEPLVRTIGRKMDISELAEPISANKDLQSIAPDQIQFQKPLPLLILMAYSNEGYILDLTKRVGADGRLNWIAPAGTWTLYALFQGWHGKMVERAAPGGEGDVIDHFSEQALTHYLDRFDNTFIGKNIRSLRAFFNDSYEVDDARGQADWTPDLPAEFQYRRGYSLYDHLPALLSKDSTDENIRVLCDYRVTISELLHEKFTGSWLSWAWKNDAIIRNQAHGSPANILDLYAASDIPETEGTDILGIKMASSAANVTGKKLTSSESATWLNEHFVSTLTDVKADVDNFFLGGVNHIFYHGTTYSPQNEKWPGWMFYAAVHFGPTNSFWNDFPALNEYVARCQSFLQAGKPDNDILFYYPFYDLISVPARRGLLEHFSSEEVALIGEPSFYPLAQLLLEQGYSFDYISDLQLIETYYSNNLLNTGFSSYRTIVLPECKFIPLETFNHLFRLAEEGAIIIIQHSLPGDVPGLYNLEQRQMALKTIKEQLDFRQVKDASFSRADIGKGAFLLGDDTGEMLSSTGIKRETMVDPGLQFIRRKDDKGPYYFIVNRGHDTISRWISVCDEFQSAGLFNPANGNYGQAAIREGLEGLNEVFIQLLPGESIILKTFNQPVEGSQYKYFALAGYIEEIKGPWKVTFTSGGPELPQKQTIKELGSWTELKGEAVKNFSGTARYSATFRKPDGGVQTWILNLGRVAESARVRLNGEEIAVLIGPHYYVEIPVTKMKENNLLEIDVSNLMANRIAALDRESGDWKKFYNVNFPAKLKENSGPDGLFNASHWEPRESGLIGPVVLIPMKILEL